jgi:hypothetical protein
MSEKIVRQGTEVFILLPDGSSRKIRGGLPSCIINSAGRNGGCVASLCPSRRELVNKAVVRTFGEEQGGEKKQMTVEERIATWRFVLPETKPLVIPRRSRGWSGRRNLSGNERRGSKSGPDDRRGSYRIRRW